MLLSALDLIKGKLARVNPRKGGFCNMREYELTIILQPSLEDSARDEIIERVTGWITNNDEAAEKPVVNHWGKRYMAYPIKKHSEGYYVFYEAKIDPENISGIERNMQYTEDILRYMFIRKEE
jgi:small subunit ribosomal protein S6